MNASARQGRQICAKEGWRARAGGSAVVVGLLALALFLLLASSASAFIYWADTQHQRIGRANNDGSRVNDNFIATGQLPFALAVDASYIYWANQTSDTIGRANIDGTGANNSFITGVNDPSGVAVNATSIYWSSLSGSIGKAKIDGTNKNLTFIPGIALPCGVALDSGHVYWVNSDGTPSYIGRADLDGSNPNGQFVTIPGTSVPCGIAVDAASIFWTEPGFFGPNGTKIGRANKATGTGADASYIANLAAPCGITVFGSQLYWANAASNAIGRANTDATEVNQSLFATGGEEICGIAVDTLSLPPTPPVQAPTPGPEAPPPAPQTTILKGPGGKLGQGEAKFSFKSSQSGSRFECKLDRRKAAKCKSPKRYTGLKPGSHLFKVWAVNSAGGKDPTPAKRRFSVPR
jgi:streptogramin lyase